MQDFPVKNKPVLQEVQPVEPALLQVKQLLSHE
jgi:hypothetical protein